MFDVYTMGFSNRTWEDTLKILQAFNVERLVDIRTLPGSRHMPQFNLEHLEKALPEAVIEYIHLKSLGGLRKPKKESTGNLAWKNEGFRGYADYMQTPEFESALDSLIKYIKEMRTVFCCTEAVFWRCHRQLVADALLIRGYQIGHIMNSTKAEPHKLTGFAKLAGMTITYPSLV